MYYSESDTRANFIDPLLQDCGWKTINIQREYYFTDGRKILNNKRGKRKFVDYLLKHRNVNLGIIEAKSSDKQPTEGLQQAIDYAGSLNVQFVYSSNGIKHYEFDTSIGKGDYIDRFPTPDDLLNMNITLYTRLLSFIDKIVTDYSSSPNLSILPGIKWI